jgi:hypothetical protein
LSVGYGRWREDISMSDVADKWGKEVAERGFAQIPNYLLLLNQFLDRETRLSPVETLVLIQIVGTWWRKDALPFPSMSTLAIRSGVSERQIQRAVNRLVEIGLLKRVHRRTRGIIASNAYDLAPLVSFLGDVAKAFPNEFPRKIDRALVTEISGRLGRLVDVEPLDELPAPAPQVAPIPQAPISAEQPVRRARKLVSRLASANRS